MAQTQINGGTQIRSGTITDTQVASGAGINITKLNKTVIAADGTNAFAADQSMGSHKLTNLTDPTSAQDAATKAYVDAAIQGLDTKASVKAATTAAGTLASSFANGQVVDGYTLQTGDRILIKTQATGSENGLYTVNSSGAPTRSTDADTSAKLSPNSYVFVEQGSTNADSGWTLTNDSVVLGTTNLTWTQFNGSGTILGGAGLTKTGNTVDVIAGDSSILVNADELHVQLADSSLSVASGLKVNTSVIAAQASFVVRETPSGSVNGSNTTYTLANTPIAGAEMVFLNGLLQEPGGEDYSISSATITFVTAPVTGDRLRVSYRK